MLILTHHVFMLLGSRGPGMADAMIIVHYPKLELRNL